MWTQHQEEVLYLWERVNGYNEWVYNYPEKARFRDAEWTTAFTIALVASGLCHGFEHCIDASAPPLESS